KYLIRDIGVLGQMVHALTDHVAEWSCELLDGEPTRATAAADPVTGLPNRLGLELMFRDHLQTAKTTSRGACAVMVDLDRFRLVNERWGLQTGELILATFGRLLPTIVNEACGTPRVTRVQGQAFVFL